MTRWTLARSVVALLGILTTLLLSWESYVAGSSLSDIIAYIMVAVVFVSLALRIASSGTS